MKLEPANLVCPMYGNGNYMRHLIGKNVGRLDMKCINCNSYFNFDELYKQKIEKVVKPQTNADRIRAMDIDHLIEWYCYHRPCGSCPYGGVECGIREWLNQEAPE